jgi:hypothetical protein
MSIDRAQTSLCFHRNKMRIRGRCPKTVSLPGLTGQSTDGFY